MSSKRKRVSRKGIAAAEHHSQDSSSPPKTESKHTRFLLKSEPEEFSIDDLEAKPLSTSCWDGVRNAQARNIMRSMRKGELAFFYHSSCKTPGIVGIVEIVREGYPDYSAWDPKSKYFDAKSMEEAPKWYMVDVKLIRKFTRVISLEELKGYKFSDLEGMWLFSRSRLSVQPVFPDHWEFICKLEGESPA